MLGSVKSVTLSMLMSRPYVPSFSKHPLGLGLGVRVRVCEVCHFVHANVTPVRPQLLKTSFRVRVRICEVCYFVHANVTPVCPPASRNILSSPTRLWWRDWTTGRLRPCASLRTGTTGLNSELPPYPTLPHPNSQNWPYLLLRNIGLTCGSQPPPPSSPYPNPAHKACGYVYSGKRVEIVNYRPHPHSGNMSTYQLWKARSHSELQAPPLSNSTLSPPWKTMTVTLFFLRSLPEGQSLKNSILT